MWLIVPAAVGHDTIANLLQVLDSGDILLDGRNSEPETFAKEAAKVIAADVRAAHASREGFVMAVGGGHTPWQMLRALANEDAPWNSVHVFQVDECNAPAGDPDRNLTHLRESLLEHAPLPARASLRVC